MQGAFIASFGQDPAPGQLERAAMALRWHRGDATHHAIGRLQVAVLADPFGGALESPKLGEGTQNRVPKRIHNRSRRGNSPPTLRVG